MKYLLYINISGCCFRSCREDHLPAASRILFQTRSALLCYNVLWFLPHQCCITKLLLNPTEVESGRVVMKRFKKFCPFVGLCLSSEMVNWKQITWGGCIMQHLSSFASTIQFSMSKKWKTTQGLNSSLMCMDGQVFAMTFTTPDKTGGGRQFMCVFLVSHSWILRKGEGKFAYADMQIYRKNPNIRYWGREHCLIHIQIKTVIITEPQAEKLLSPLIISE